MQKRKIGGITNIGTFYYDDSKNRTNGEFNVVLARKNSYDFYDVIYYTSPMSLKEMQSEEAQVRAVQGLSVGTVGFVATEGYEVCPDCYGCVSPQSLYANDLED